MIKILLSFTFVIILSIVGFENLVNSNEIDGEKIYKQNCASCHGADLHGGLAKSLADGKWQFGDKDSEIIEHIKDGIPQHGMPEFKGKLKDSEIEATVDYIRKEEAKYIDPEYKLESYLETFDYKIKVELVTDEVESPWAIDFISNKKILVTEQSGNLRIIENGRFNPNPIEGIPEVLYSGQGGLLDVTVDPEYDSNGWIYISYSHEIDGRAMTKVIRGKINDNKWIQEEVLFQAAEKFYIDTRHHYGSRIVFDNDGYLYFSIGDRGKRNMAQDLSRPNGKIHRIHKDGSIPEDNPFVNNSDAIPSIFAYGSRNAQGLSIHPVTDELWESEHGQKGGDEINIIKSGKNYGWDVITYGRNYDGSVSTKYTKKPGMEIPILYWRPSIAVCPIDFYDGDLFKRWKNNLLVGALKYEEVRLLDIEDNRVIHQEIILKDQGRVRDVQVSPDGSIYVALNSPDEILRLTPEEEIAE